MSSGCKRCFTDVMKCVLTHLTLSPEDRHRCNAPKINQRHQHFNELENRAQLLKKYFSVKLSSKILQFQLNCCNALSQSKKPLEISAGESCNPTNKDLNEGKQEPRHLLIPTSVSYCSFI